MPISRKVAPTQSRKKLAEALRGLGTIKAKHQRWMKFAPSKSGTGPMLHPHPLYCARLASFLDGQRLGATLKKAGWMYFLRDQRKRLAWGEVSIVSGRHMNARLSEGPFAGKVLRSIEQLQRDPRIRGHRYELRSVRLESLHLFCLWLKAPRAPEYFIPVASGYETLKAGEWMSRRQFTTALRTEGRRVRAAQERMSSLLRTYHAQAADREASR
jgi:hypothetical protein